jgi:diguanylate cyclase (GGDEF)-like protein
MMNTILHPDTEARRLDALYRYLQLDSGRDPAFDLLAEAAAEICSVPYASVTLVDRDRVWIKSGVGLEPGDVPRAESYCSLAIMQDGLLEIPDLSQDARTAGMTLVRREFGAQMYAGAVLVTGDGYHIGTLCVMDRQPRHLTQRQKHLLSGLARQVMTLIELRAHERLLKDALERAEYLAATDVLTGLVNRRVLFERLDSELARCRRYGTPLAMVLIDLDHFKNINDTFGHAAGDTVLRNVGALLTASVREVDIAGRYGGEEMCILLPQTSLQGALTFAENIRRALAAVSHDVAGTALTATASLGVAGTETGDCDAGELFSQADRALYAAKHGGRNRVMSVEDCPPVVN